MRSKVLLRVVAVADEQGAEEIVVGLPRPLGGGTQRAAGGGASPSRSGLAASTAMPVVTWDERFTSKLADRGGKQNRRAGFGGGVLYVAGLS